MAGFIDPRKLTRARVRAGLTPRALARAAGVSHTLVSAIEAGTTAGSPTSAKKLADALGVDIEELWVWDQR